MYLTVHKIMNKLYEIMKNFIIILLLNIKVLIRVLALHKYTYKKILSVEKLVMY